MNFINLFFEALVACLLCLLPILILFLLGGLQL